MILRANAERNAVEIDDAGNFRAFSVRIEGAFADAGQRAALMQRFVETDEGAHVWVREQALREWPGLVDEAWWREGLDGMIAAARKYGFYDEGRHTIRAHVETAEAGQR